MNIKVQKQENGHCRNCNAEGTYLAEIISDDGTMETENLCIECFCKMLQERVTLLEGQIEALTRQFEKEKGATDAE